MEIYNDFDFDLIMNDLELTYHDYDIEKEKYSKYIETRQIIVYKSSDINLCLISGINNYIILYNFLYFYKLNYLIIFLINYLKFVVSILP